MAYLEEGHHALEAVLGITIFLVAATWLLERKIERDRKRDLRNHAHWMKRVPLDNDWE
jgi:hypothetical protein